MRERAVLLIGAAERTVPEPSSHSGGMLPAGRYVVLTVSHPGHLGGYLVVATSAETTEYGLYFPIRPAPIAPAAPSS